MFSSGVAVRTFSSTSKLAVGSLVKPPVAVFGIEGRYATALYSAACKEKQLDAVEGDLKKFGDLLNKDVRLNEFVYNPLIKTSLKKEGLENALKKQKFNVLTINLVGLMADNNRMKNIRAVINSFDLIMSAVRGEVICEVTTAKPLDAAMNKELQDALKAFMKKGENLKLTTKVDPTLIGGMTVSIGERYADMSIANKIKIYENLLRETI